MKEMKYIVRDFTAALNSIHQLKLAHGKIKSTNLFLDSGEQVLTDFEPLGIFDDENYYVSYDIYLLLISSPLNKSSKRA